MKTMLEYDAAYSLQGQYEHKTLFSTVYVRQREIKQNSSSIYPAKLCQTYQANTIISLKTADI